MITIIHGTDIVSSRKYFFQEKQKYPEIEILDGEKITLTDLVQILEGGGLFDENKSIFIEQLFSRKKRKDEFSLLSDYLQKHSTNSIFLWEGKELEKSSLMTFKSAVPRVFKLPQTLFVFLDNIKPGNGKSLISFFHQTLENTEPEMIFFMLVRHIRLMLGLKKIANDSIDELKRLAPWQKEKLSKQASLFGEDELISTYNNLFEIELGQKTGTLSGTLASRIDFLLLEI